jgi:hypothetical protein
MKLFLFALALLFVTPFGAAAAQDQATVVSSCGSITLQAGTPHNRTIDTNGVTCSALVSSVTFGTGPQPKPSPKPEPGPKK